MAVTGDNQMPVFVIKGKDRLALDTIRAYQALCTDHGLTEQAREVGKAYREVLDWQRWNPGALQLPDHPHVPASGD